MFSREFVLDLAIHGTEDVKVGSWLLKFLGAGVLRGIPLVVLDVCVCTQRHGASFFFCHLYLSEAEDGRDSIVVGGTEHAHCIFQRMVHLQRNVSTGYPF